MPGLYCLWLRRHINTPVDAIRVHTMIHDVTSFREAQKNPAKISGGELTQPNNRL